jgi:hypothetical protein
MLHALNATRERKYSCTLILIDLRNAYVIAPARAPTTQPNSISNGLSISPTRAACGKCAGSRAGIQ